MRKLLLKLFFLLFIAVLIALVPQQSLAQSATSCKTTKIGNPQGGPPQEPAECQQNGGGGAVVGTELQQAVVKLGREHLTNGTYIMGSPSRDWASAPQNNAPSHFDCSGFAGWVWYWASGGKVKMLGQTSADWAENSGKYQKFQPSQLSQIQPGDLVYFAGADGTVANPGHVGIYEGSGSCGASDCFMEYYSTGKPGKEDSLGKRKSDFSGFLRPVIK